MPAAKLNDRLVRALIRQCHADGRRRELADSELHGFRVRVGPDGKDEAAVFSVRYFYRGRRRRDDVGTLEHCTTAQARKLAGDRQLLARAGVDPRPEQSRQILFGELAERYVAAAKHFKIGWRGDELALERDFLPHWRRRPAEEITRADVKSQLLRIRERAPVGANRAQAMIARLFSWAVEEELLPHSPCTRLRRVHVEEPDGTVLTDEQLQAVWSALAADPSPSARAVQLMALTGLRAQEVTLGRLSEIVDPPSWWEIPAARMKGRKGFRRPHLVYLTPFAIETCLDPLAALRVELDTDRMFPSRRDRKLALASLYARVAQRAGLEVTARDLRRTVATGLARMGVVESTIDEVLAHVRSSITRRHYVRYDYAREKRAAWEAWSRHVQRLLGGAARGAVVPFRRRH